MLCPECGKELGILEEVEYGRLGVCCSDCDIKIYKEIMITK